ncbi:MAG: hypothetical protein O7G83_02200 [Proteobacteria bacterium]|nr:hypothetical protein [Pseudomonadota bacterium]
MADIDDLKARIDELEVDLQRRDDQIKELREEHRRAVDLVGEMREHVEDSSALIDSWIEGFYMELNDDGQYEFPQDRIT